MALAGHPPHLVRVLFQSPCVWPRVCGAAGTWCSLCHPTASSKSKPSTWLWTNGPGVMAPISQNHECGVGGPAGLSRCSRRGGEPTIPHHVHTEVPPFTADPP